MSTMFLSLSTACLTYFISTNKEANSYCKGKRTRRLVLKIFA